MTKQLDIFIEHPVPLVFITGRLIVLGTSGAGKTSSARVMAEEAWAAKMRFGVIDLQSDWSGLKSSADGTAPGIPVVIFGGDRADVPLDPTAAVLTAEIVADLEQPFVLDMGNWSKTKQVRFIGPFLERLMEIMPSHTPMALFCDEVDVYAPQKPMSPEANTTLSATVDVAKRGRKRGVFPVFVTQRNSGVNKDITELCQVLLVYRTPGFLDQKVVENALGRTVTKERTAELLAQVEDLPNGTAIVVSKLPELRILETLRVRLPTTFDSSATPELGKRRREPKVLAQPDLEALRAKLSTQIERQKADDPKALRTTIATLRKELEAERKRQPAPAKPETKTVVKYAVRGDHVARLERLAVALDKTTDRFGKQFSEFNHATIELFTQLQLVRSAPPPTVPAARSIAGSNGGGAVRAGAPNPDGRPVATTRAIGEHGVRGRHDREPAARTPERADGITARQQRFLDAAATLHRLGVETTRETVAGWLGVHPRGGSVGEELKALVDAGFIAFDRGAIAVTEQGLASAGDIPAEEAVARAKEGLSPRQRKIFDLITEAYPERITREAIAERMGIHPRGGSFGEDLGRLRGRGLIEYERGEARARDFLFAGAAA